MTDRKLTALDLDQALRNPLRVAAAQAERMQPTPLNDQLDAATTHADRVQLAVGEYLTDVHRTLTDYADMPEWVRLGVADEIAGWETGRAKLCLHNPTRRRPQPVFAAAWKPGLVVCDACRFLFKLPNGSVPDRTCDRCGHVVSGDRPDVIRVNTFRLGFFTWFYGTCHGCVE